MWRTAIAFSVGTLLSLSAEPPQTPTDFSGTWRSDTARSDSAHQAAPIGPITLIISQTPAEISIQTQTRPKDRPLVANEKLVCRLDGAEKTTTGNTGVPIGCRTRWEGAGLVVETARTVSGSTVTTNWVLRMDATGKEMTIKKTLMVQHGYQSRDANNVGTGTDVFVKIKPGSGR